MANLIYTELLKLKRSKMFLVSILGAMVMPLMCFIVYFGKKVSNLYGPIQLNEVFSESNMYIVFITGVPLYGAVASYIFNREHTENTLKNLLTIPVPKIKFMAAKYIVLLFWILVLTIVSWGLTLGLGLIGNFEGLDDAVLAQSFVQFFVGGVLLFLLMSPIIFITLMFKNYVASIIAITLITMVNVVIANSDYRALYPWSAISVIANKMVVNRYPLEYSYISILSAAIVGFTASILYLKEEEI